MRIESQPSSHEPTHHEHVAHAPSPAARLLSQRWPALAAGTLQGVLRIPHALVRDQRMNLAALAPQVVLMLDHPADQIEMSAIAADVTVHFAALATAPLGAAGAAGVAGADRRSLAVLPSEAEFLAPRGALPCISMTRDETAQPLRYRMFDHLSRARCCFAFEGDAAPLAHEVLERLRLESERRWANCRSLRAQLDAQPYLSQWSSAQRQTAAALWEALPSSVQARVCDYYGQHPSDAARLADLNVVEVWQHGQDVIDLALVRCLLASALDYWMRSAQADAVPAAFWQAAMAHAPGKALSVQDFSRDLDATVHLHLDWQAPRAFFHELLAWLGQPALLGDLPYQRLHRSLARALRRAEGLPLPVPDAATTDDCLAQLDAVQVRRRLLQAQRSMAVDHGSDAPASMVLAARALDAWIGRLCGPQPIMLHADARVGRPGLDEACVAGGSVDCVINYRLPATLDAAAVADIFSIESALLPSGEIAWRRVAGFDGEDGGEGDDGEDDDDGEDGDDGAAALGWWRVYRFLGQASYDTASREWQVPCRELSVQGDDVSTRTAFDAHMQQLQADMAAEQDLLWRSTDTEVITIAAGQDRVLAPVSRWPRRTVRLEGAGGRVQLPEDTVGTLVLDVTQLDVPAPVTVLTLAPRLLFSLRKCAELTRDGQRFACYRSWRGAALSLEIGPLAAPGAASATARAERLCNALDDALRDEAWRIYRRELVDPAQHLITVSPVIDRIQIDPLQRDVLFHLRGRRQEVRLSGIGSGQVLLLVSAPSDAPDQAPDEAPSELLLQLALAPTLLPRYGYVPLRSLESGQLAGAIVDYRQGGAFLLSYGPGVSLQSSTWDSTTTAIQASHERWADDVLAWDARLMAGQAFSASERAAIVDYGNALDQLDDAFSRELASILEEETREEREANLVQASDNDPRAGEVVARLLVYYFGGQVDTPTAAQWREQVRARAGSTSMVARMIGVFIDVRWSQDEGAQFYAGLAGFYRFLQMRTTDVDQERRLALEEARLEAALALVAGDDPGDMALHETGLAALRGNRLALLHLKLILVSSQDRRLFDDDPVWREQLQQRLLDGVVRSRRNALLDLMASVMAGSGGSSAVALAYQGKAEAMGRKWDQIAHAGTTPDVMVFDQVSRLVPPQAHTMPMNPAGDCQLPAAVAMGGAMLVFIGDVGTALAHWHIGNPVDRKQRHITAMFQVIKAVGWSMQQSTAFVCQPDASGARLAAQVIAPFIGIGMGANYLAGGLAELVHRRRGPHLSWRAQFQTLMQRNPGQTFGKCLQTIDAAGNILLLFAEASKISALLQESEAPDGLVLISATFSCASLSLGSTAAVGELGTKNLLTPAAQFYRLTLLSSSVTNVCSAATNVLSTSTAHPRHGASRRIDF